MPGAIDRGEAIAWLEGHGWSSARDIGERAQDLISDRIRISAGRGDRPAESEAARSFLAGFGELVLPLAGGGEIALVPTPAAPGGDESVLAAAEAEWGRPVFPVGVRADGAGLLLVTPEGRFSYADRTGTRYLADEPVEALARLRDGGELPTVSEYLASGGSGGTDGRGAEGTAGELPGTASSLLVDRTVKTRTNTVGGAEPDLHPAVRAFLDALPPYQREPFAAWCAETSLISDELLLLDERRGDGAATTLDEARAHFTGSQILSVAIREGGDPEHGKPVRPCRSCAALLAELGVEVITG
ncbi:YwqJ-related putative deaminase [Kitasatospora sp. NPDC059646]|uniref:YwqJ-related putative deaminase n=1 Tax=Kitasatospora sp. NPDC059646 TaxID=3346893 RepID=UPI0036C82367